MLQVNDKVKVHIYRDGKEIETRHHDTVFTVYEKNGKLGIDWNTDHSPYTCGGDIFCPFRTFAQCVIFENIENGKKYHFSNILNTLERL